MVRLVSLNLWMEIGQLHGTWGGLTVNPEIDEIEIIG